VQPAAPSDRVSAWRALSRALRGVCPACGLTRVFLHRFRSERRCDACGWWYERGPGHWIGGSEINMIVTYWTTCLIFITANLIVGFSWISLVLAGGFTIAFSVAIYRPSRGLFIALDYLVDPHYDPTEGEDDAPGNPHAGPGVPPLPTRAPRDENPSPSASS